MTPTSEELQRILERVEGASGPDRELDWELRKAFLPDEVPYVLQRYEETKAECKKNGLWPARKGACWRDATGGTRPYTASLDAVIGLAEGLGFTLHAWEERRWFIRLPMGSGAIQFGGPPHDSISRALIAALLRALIQKENGG